MASCTSVRARERLTFDDGVALLILCMMSGGVIGPAVESLMVSSFGIRVVPIVLAGFAALTLTTFVSALRFSPPEAVPALSL